VSARCREDLAPSPVTCRSLGKLNAKPISVTHATRWARLRNKGFYPVRRGAWNRVTSSTAVTVAVDARGKPLELPHAVVEVVERIPSRWTVVRCPPLAFRLLPRGWGDHYAVCPSCAHRVALLASPIEIGCERCGGSFAVAWDEGYLGRPPVRLRSWLDLAQHVPRRG
jgi:hypothetical protein